MVNDPQCSSAILSIRKENRDSILSSLKNVSRSIKRTIEITAASVALLMPYSYPVTNYYPLQQNQAITISEGTKHSNTSIKENKTHIYFGKYTLTNLPNMRAGLDSTDTRWAGKVASTSFLATNNASRVTQVHATWTVAFVNSKFNGEIVQWGGVGGWINNDPLIQSGTASEFKSSKGKYFAWLNIYPGHAIISNTNQRIPNTMQEINGFSVKPGDKIVLDIVLIHNKNNTWEISLLNQTTGNSLLIDFQYSADVHTAEWILERPQLSTNNDYLERLPVFNKANFGDKICPPDSNYAIIDGKKGTISQFPHKNIFMVNRYRSQNVIARPEDLSVNGSCFSVEQTGSGVVGSNF